MDNLSEVVPSGTWRVAAGVVADYSEWELVLVDDECLAKLEDIIQGPDHRKAECLREAILMPFLCSVGNHSFIRACRYAFFILVCLFSGQLVCVEEI